MKAVMAEVPPQILQWRSRTGADRWDEFWEGVLHMPPAPNREHLNFEWELETWLRTHWAKPRGCKVYHGANLAYVGGWPDDYRIPDLLLLAPDCPAIDHNEYFEGAPTAVIEIRSPGDETIEKLPFYAKLGVPEVWVIDRDTRIPVLYELSVGEYVERGAATGKWLQSRATGVQLRSSRGRHLEIQIIDEPDTFARLPQN
jgi:Uma2 family endonuclease